MGFIYFFFKGFFFFALSVATLAYTTGLYFSVNDPFYPIFLFFLTLIAYNFYPFTIQQVGTTNHFRKYIIGCSLPFLLYFLFKISFLQVVFLSIASLLTLAYYYPIFNKKLREFWMLKPLVIGFVLSWATFLVTICDKNIEKYHYTFLLVLFLERCFLCTILALIFDYRDVEQDEINGINTLPLRFGIKKVQKKVSLLLFVMGVFSAIFINKYLVFVYLMTFFSNIKALKTKDSLFYLVIVDGIILIYAILFIL